MTTPRGMNGSPSDQSPTPSEPPDSDEPVTGDLAQSGWRRSARLASLPIGYAGRATLGLGRKLTGTPAETVTEDMQRRAADQLFRVLGELKGGAMKVGQALSIFEAGLPDEIAGPYREHLSRLQDSAPPMPTARVHAVLARELGSDWRSQFRSFEQRPAAAASIGQVHRAVWGDGRRVAVKVQYPGADEALRSDLRQMARLGRVAAPLAGGLDIEPLIAELTARISEEVDYTIEASSQQQAALGFADHPEFVVPAVITNTSRVMVTEWLDGVPMSRAQQFEPERRNRIALKYVRFLFAGPSTVGLLHADPHPGNFLVLDDDRLGVVDFGLVSRLPDGLPSAMGRILRIAQTGDAAQVVAGLHREGFVPSDIDAEDLLDYLSPFVEPATVPEFEFNREWMQQQFHRIKNPHSSNGVGTRLNLPASYLLIHRVWLGGISVLSQLGARAPFASVLEEFLPGYAEPTPSE